jgi:hypothetical protein
VIWIKCMLLLVIYTEGFRTNSLQISSKSIRYYSSLFISPISHFAHFKSLDHSRTCLQLHELYIVGRSEILFKVSLKVQFCSVFNSFLIASFSWILFRNKHNRSVNGQMDYLAFKITSLHFYNKTVNTLVLRHLRGPLEMIRANWADGRVT